MLGLYSVYILFSWVLMILFFHLLVLGVGKLPPYSANVAWHPFCK